MTVIIVHHDQYRSCYFILYNVGMHALLLCRTSLLTGRRPDTTHVWQISGKEYWRQVVNATSLPQHFKENGVRCSVILVDFKLAVLPPTGNVVRDVFCQL